MLVRFDGLSRVFSVEIVGGNDVDGVDLVEQVGELLDDSRGIFGGENLGSGVVFVKDYKLSVGNMGEVAHVHPGEPPRAHNSDFEHHLYYAQYLGFWWLVVMASEEGKEAEEAREERKCEDSFFMGKFHLCKGEGGERMTRPKASYEK